ncbi:O-methyltransferase [Halopolyspora algeriensis]|uniref:O-methyltransferase n=1 Tax=Halopolyspora algeriensis TaxID=1500506 RepID=UPI001FE57FB3|nr:O-methyltransferase [Halopolyspora algeriensis]
MLPEIPTHNDPAGREHAGDHGADSGEAAVGGEYSGGIGPESLPVSIGAALRFLAAVLQAKAVVEIGTGSGTTALAMLEGMAPDGVLTSIDLDPDAQRVARATLAEAGVAGSRTRLITGVARDVLPRLTEEAYDLVFVDAVKQEYPHYLEVGTRLLRPGGALVFRGVVPDRDPGDPERCHAARELTRAVHADTNLVPLVLPIGEGLLTIART